LGAREFCRTPCGGNFTFDKNGDFYSTTKAYGYIKKREIPESYEFWLGLLNSPF
jgi:hypothetical protein